MREEVIENGSEATSRITKKAARSNFKKMAFPVCSASEVKSKGKAGEECVLINKMNKQIKQGIEDFYGNMRLGIR